MAITIGSQAPAWSGIDQFGKSHASSEYDGSWLLLYFYPQDDTPGCTVEACGFRDAFGQLRTKTEIVGVSPDTADSHKFFADKYDLPFTLIADPDKTIIKTYGTDNSVFKKRTSFLIKPGGIVAKIYENIDCAAHAGDIGKDLDALAGK
jgi:thioredoxin-dependent peroxiredoxin